LFPTQERTVKKYILQIGILVPCLILLLGIGTAAAQPALPGAALGTAFTYQGLLQLNGAPINGPCDFRFALWDSLTSGAQLGATQTVTNLAVSSGRFTAVLNGGGQFGPAAFDGSARWLQVDVRCPAGSGSYTGLSPRQELAPAPYAQHAADAWSLRGNAGTDDTVNAIGTTDGMGLVFKTSDTPRMYVDAGGRVGVGAPPNASVFHVTGTSWFQGDTTPLPASAGMGVAIGANGTNGYIFAFDYASFTPKNLLLNNPGGNVGVGTLSPIGGRLHVDGGSGTAIYSTSTSGIGLQAVSGSNAGVYSYSTSDYGVDGRSENSVGVYGQSYSSGGMWGVGPYIGVQANSTGTDPNRQAVRGDNNGSATGYAGLFYGNTWVVGTLYKNAGAFKIDHPLDPLNKYLVHSFVESPDMKNIYDGVVTTDTAGFAVVQLPDYFEALNGNFRYQLTVIGQFAQAIVAKEIANNQFTIQTDQPSVRVSWQVTGIRRDAYAEYARLPVEQMKPLEARGTYLSPQAYGQPLSSGEMAGNSMSSGMNPPSNRPTP
jgi:hypothetical protein